MDSALCLNIETTLFVGTPLFSASRCRYSQNYKLAKEHLIERDDQQDWPTQ